METPDAHPEIPKDDQLEPILEDPQLTLSKAKPANNILHRYNKVTSEEETTLGSHFNNSQLLNSHKTLKGGDRYNADVKSSLVMENLDDSFQNDTLSSVSKPGSVLLGSGRLGDCLSISDRISCERSLYDYPNPSGSKLSSRSNIELDVKANNFDQLRRYKKVFQMFKLSAEAKERLQQLFYAFFELEKQKAFINMIYDLKKIATYMNVKRKHSSHKSNNSTKTSIPRDSPEKSDRDSDRRYNCYILIKKAFRILRTRTYYKSLNTKAEKFLYYKLLLKYMFQWIEYVRTKPHTLRQPDFDQSKLSSRRTYDDVFISPFQSKRSYRCHSMLNETIEEEKHPFTKYYEDNLLLKTIIALKRYSNGQKKKKNLEEILLDSLEAKYVFKPFRGWLYQMKYIKLRRKAILKIQRIIYFARLRTVFNKIKNAQMPKHTRRVSGVILNQSHILKRDQSRDQSRDHSRGFSQGARRRYDKENSFSYNEKSSILDKSDFRQQFKTCLAGIFPDQKKNTGILEQNPNRSNIQQPTDYSANSQSFFILPKSLLVQTQTEDTGVSLTLDTSHFATNENVPGPADSKVAYKSNVDRSSYLQPSKALDHSLFRLNASKIEKPSKKMNKSQNIGNERESSFLQRSIQAKYFLAGGQGQDLLEKARKKSPSPIPYKDNSTFSILDTSIQAIEQKENKPVTKPVPVKPVHDLQASKVNPKPLSKQRSTSTNTNARSYAAKHEKNKENQNGKDAPASKVQKQKYKNMVEDLEEHLKFLNRSLLNQQLINKKLHSMKDQFTSET